MPPFIDQSLTFRGRLGYACSNTMLKMHKPPIFCSRTCRLITIREKGIEYAKQLGLQNIRDMIPIIKWNEENNIRFMRMSSDMFPFAGHPTLKYSLEFAQSELETVGKLAAQFGHRLTMHPGQYDQLGSTNPEVVRKSIIDLEYHAEMLDRMKLPPDSVMVIHMGGVYGDKQATLERFEKIYLSSPESVRRRLVLENDELCYSVSDLLPICQKLSIPLVLDWHHHTINPGTISDIVPVLPQITETWTRRELKQKQHYSEQRDGAVTIMERRAHSNRVKGMPPCEDDMDLMIEAKDKEQAVLQLYKIFNFETYPKSSFLPPSIETKHTSGRKSSKGKESDGSRDKKRKITERKISKRKLASKKQKIEGEDEESNGLVS